MNKEEMKDGIELIMQLLTALLEALGKAEDAMRSGALEDKDQAINRAVGLLFALQA
jgi:flagellin-specific chaperone FliS